MTFTKKQISDEYWRRGNLSYLWHEGQKLINLAFTTALHQLFVCNVSRQFGKSYWAICIALMKAMSGRNLQIRYGTAFHKDLLTFIIPAFTKILSHCPAHLRPKYLRSGSKFVFPNGSEIHLVGLDQNPDSLRGNTLDLIIIDEAAFVDKLEYLYESVIIPATTHRPDCRIIMISTPPRSPTHVFVDFCLRAQRDGGYVVLNIYQNPMLTQATINRLMKESGGEDSTTWKREYLCQFVADAALVIIPEWSDANISAAQEDPLVIHYQRYVGMDLGTVDLTAAVFGYYDFMNATLYLEDELSMSGPQMTTDKLAAVLKDKEKELWKGAKVFRRVADNNNPLLLNDLHLLHQLHFNPTSKDNLHAMINDLRVAVRAGRIKIHPRCQMTIQCLKHGIWNEKRTEFARSKALFHLDHLAALMYLWRNVDVVTNPIPPMYDYDVNRQHTFLQEAPLTKAHAAVKSIFTPKQRGNYD